jgi:hypothetical protein
LKSATLFLKAVYPKVVLFAKLKWTTWGDFPFGKRSFSNYKV